MNLFNGLFIESHSYCTRKCPTCLRQSNPAAQKKREGKVLDTETVLSILDQAVELGFTNKAAAGYPHNRGYVGFFWFSEPLLEPRLLSFLQYSHKKGFRNLLITNGDLLHPSVAETLKPYLERIEISLYGPEDPVTREKSLRLLFPEFSSDRIMFWTQGHITSHFSPKADLQTLIEEKRMLPCKVTDLEYMIVTCIGEMALCCEDLGCEWNLGNIHTSSLKELWFSRKHEEILNKLGAPGGKQHYEYCRICPR